MSREHSLEQIAPFLPQDIRGRLDGLPALILDEACELRLRLDQNPELVIRGGEGRLLAGDPVSQADLEEMLMLLCGSSVYSYTDEIRQGFITVPGGHRAGICGRGVIKEGEVSTLRDVSSIAFRISHEIPGAADPVIPSLLGNGGVQSALVLSPPGGGKTTLLRDAARQLSYKGYRVCLCDERGELSGGGPGSGYDLGPRCDILTGVPKGQGMRMLIRAMSPQILITDEIGADEDVAALLDAAVSGVAVLASVHGSELEELCRKPQLKRLVDSGCFSLFITLKGKPAGEIKEIRHWEGTTC